MDRSKRPPAPPTGPAMRPRRKGEPAGRARSGTKPPSTTRASRRRRPTFLLLVVLGAAAVLLGALALTLRAGWPPWGAKELNVLLITLDTTRADHLGCYGSTTSRTPNLDRLAAEGVRFTHCASCVPLTLPSHCSIMTGTYPYVHGVRRNGFERLSEGNTTLAELLKTAGLSTHAIVASAVLAGRFGLSQGFDSYLDVPTAGAKNPAAAELPADRITDSAIGVLQAQARSRFFLWVHYYDPHYPYESKAHPDPLSREAYADEVSFMDAQIGRLLATLRDLRLAKNTLIIAVGDHGEGLGDHGESEHGYFLYETTMHVPLLISCPSLIPSGKTIAATCRTIDLAPTILDYLGLPPSPSAQGTSLRPVMNAGEKGSPETAYGETMSPNEVLGLSALRCLHSGGWKLILSPKSELYRYQEDPGETVNALSDQPNEASRLKEELKALLEHAPARPKGSTSAGEISPQDVELFRSLGYIAGTVTTPDSASTPMEELEPSGGNPADHAAAIEVYVRSHRFTADRQWSQAEPLLRQVVADIPGASNPLNDLSLALRKQNRGGDILPICAQVLSEKPGATSLRLFYAGELMAARQPQEALAQLRIAVAKEPNSAEAHFQLANVLRANKLSDEAREHYETAIRLNPKNPIMLQGYALLCVKEDRLELAATYLKRAFELNPRSTQIKRDLQRVLERIRTGGSGSNK